MASRILAYLLAGAPAAVGIGFVARYGYVTSDTAADGIATAFLLGMIAAGAFVGPAVAIAVAGNGRRKAAVALWLLTCLAIAANWSHTLGAIAHRTAGTEAESAKASAAIADARGELSRIAGERKALPAFTPATADDVAAARAAVKAAEESRKAECEARGKHCRAREETEQQKHVALATALASKAATDRAAKLDAEAAAIRAQLAKAPAVKDANPLGSALARLLPWVPAASAATYQQAVISLIAELLIAAGLALPELLRRNPAPVAPGRPLAGVSTVGGAEPAGARQQAATAVSASDAKGTSPPRTATGRGKGTGSVGQFMLACLPRAKGEEAPLAAIYARYVRWCEEQSPGVAPEEAAAFGEQFKALAERVRLGIEKRGGKVYVCDVRLAA